MIRIAVVVLLVQAASLPGFAQEIPGIRAWLDKGRSFRSAFEPLVRPVLNSVVVIKSERFGRSRTILGTVVDANGWIVTKASELGQSVVCRTTARDEFAPKIVGRDDTFDLALLKIEAEGLTPVTFSMKDLKPGQWLVSVGDRRRPLSVGVVSWPAMRIPRNGRGWLGVMLAQVKKKGGVRITKVAPTGPGAGAGLETNDVITAVDGKPTKTRVDLGKLLRDKKPGARVTFEVKRGSDAKKIDVVLAQRPFGLVSHAADVNLRLSERRDDFPLAVRHDCVISYTRCGGPVLDIHGKVVGLNIARSGRTQALALPSRVVVEAVARLRR